MDKPKFKLSSFAMVAAVIGFMIAVQFQTIKEPTERDTKDIWQLREEILKEKKLQSELLAEIRATEGKLGEYETMRQQGKEQVLRETLNELMAEAGLTEIKGPGIILSVRPVLEEPMLGERLNPSISPDLLKKLTNEMNMYEARHISIDGQRVINSTVIREISSQTKVDGHSLKDLPFEIKVITDNLKDAEKLSNRMKVSQSAEEFFIENLALSVSEPLQEITIEAYEKDIRVSKMKPAKSGEGGNP